MEGNTESFVDKFSRGVSWIAHEARRGQAFLGRGLVSMRGKGKDNGFSMGEVWSESEAIPDRIAQNEQG